MNYKLYVVRIFSQRWEETCAFYKDKVGFVPMFESAEMGWAQFELGGAHIGLERLAPDDPEAEDCVGRFVGVSLLVDDIDASYHTLTERGVPFLGPPEKQPWGGTLAHFKDPDGNVITLLGTN